MVVRRRATTFDLSEHPASRPEPVDEVGSGPRDEAVIRCQDDLLVEAQTVRQESGNNGLDRAALGSMYVDRVDVGGRLEQVGTQLRSQLIHSIQLDALVLADGSPDEPRVGDVHARELGSSCRPKLGLARRRLGHTSV